MSAGESDFVRKNEAVLEGLQVHQSCDVLCVRISSLALVRDGVITLGAVLMACFAPTLGQF